MRLRKFRIIVNRCVSLSIIRMHRICHRLFSWSHWECPYAFSLPGISQTKRRTACFPSSFQRFIWFLSSSPFISKCPFLGSLFRPGYININELVRLGFFGCLAQLTYPISGFFIHPVSGCKSTEADQIINARGSCKKPEARKTAANGITTL